MTEIIRISDSLLKFVKSPDDPQKIVQVAPVQINNTGLGDRNITQAYIAGTALSSLRLVKLNSSNELVYADSSTDATVLGLTYQAVSMGVAPITILSGLATDPSWTWTRGSPLFLATNGQLSHSVPVSGFIVPIGNAEAPTIINLNIAQGVQIG